MKKENILTKVGITLIKEKIRENCLRQFGHMQYKPTDEPINMKNEILLTKTGVSPTKEKI